MKKYIAYIFFVCLNLGFILLQSKDGFSQTNQIHGNQKIMNNATPVSKDNPPVTGITAGRARALAGGVLALISVIIGVVAKVRAARSGTSGRWRSWAITALVVALISIGLSVVHLSTATGAFGSGSGRAGAIVALVVGLVGVTISTLALRSK